MKGFWHPHQIFPKNRKFDPRRRVEGGALGNQPNVYDWKNQKGSFDFDFVNLGKC